MSHTNNILSKEKVRLFVSSISNKGYSKATIKRKIASVLKFADWAYETGRIHHNQLKEIKAVFSKTHVNKKLQNKPTSNIKQVWQAVKDRLLIRANIANLVGLFLLVAFAVGSGVGIYNQFFGKAKINLAAQPGPVRAGRIINFQGFLTDNAGTPIINNINMRYRLYNAPTGGDVLYDTNTCSVQPDNDGIVNVLIGTNTPAGYGCWDGGEIPAEVFSMNPSVYLGVTVGTDPEMTDRQQIANVGYAINSELLQGYPLGTGSASVPFINGDGDLLIGAISPSIGSINTSANFRLSSANAITIASAGSGDVILQATQSGNINLRTGGSTDTNSRLYINNSGNVGIGTTAPSEKLDVLGTVKMTGIQLTTGASTNYVLSSDASGVGTWTDISSTAGPWTLTGNNLYPDATSYNVGIGATNPGTAKLYVNGNVGVGVTNPTHRLQLADHTTAAGGLGLGADVELYRSTSNTLSLASGDSFTMVSGNFTQTAPATTTSGHAITASSLTSGTGLSVTSAATAFSSGKMLTLTKTGASGSTAFTGDIANFTYSQTFNGGVGLNSTGNALDVSRAITLNNAGNTHTISGALVTLSDSGTQTAGTLNHTANVLDITQNYTTSTGTGIYLKYYGAGNAFRVDDESSDTTPFIIDATGNVGIGTTAPVYKLDVNGDIRIASGSDLYIGTYGLNDNGSVNSGASLVGLYKDTMTYVTANTNVQNAIKELDSAIGTLSGGSVTGTGTTNYIAKWSTATGLADSSIFDNGNVGIGTTVPAATLDVNGNIYATSFADGDNSNYYLNPAGNTSLLVAGNVGIGTTVPGYKLDVAGTTQTEDLRLTDLSSGTSNTILTLNGSDVESRDIGSFLLPTGAFGQTLYYDTSWTATSNLYNDGGNIGIGTSVPSTILQVGDGTPTYATGSDVYFANDLEVDGTIYGAINPGFTTGSVIFQGAAGLAQDNANFFWDDSSKELGIGTTAPAGKLHIVGTGNTYTYIDGNQGIGDSSGYLILRGRYNSANVQLYIKSGGSNPEIKGTGSNAMLLGHSNGFAFQNYDGTSEWLTIKNTGYVGIGDITPDSKLDVEGTVTMTGFKMGTGATAGYVLSSDASGVGTWTDVSSTAGPWTLVGSDLYPDDTSYNVGIGTTTPGAYKLNVVGNTYLDGTLNITGAITAPTSTNTINNLIINSGALSGVTGYTQTSGALAFSGGGNFSVDSAAFDVTTGGAVSGVTTLSMNNQLTNSYANTAAINLTGNASGITFGGTGVNQIITGGTNALALMPGGNVGIGTTAPGAKLDVDGNILVQGGGSIDTRAAGTLTIGGTTQTGLVLGRSGQSTKIANLTTNGVVYTSSGDGTLNSETALDETRGGTGQTTITQGDLLYGSAANTLGKLGIGTSGYALMSNGTIPSWVDASSLGTNYWTLSGSNLYPNQTTYNVGVGTTTPGSLLSVAGGLSVGSTYAAVVAPINGAIFEGSVGIGTTNPNFLLDIKGDSGGRFINTSLNSGIYIDPVNNRIGTNFIANNLTLGGANNLIFETYDSGWTPRMYISNTGNVGIGTTVPGAKLEVNGQVKITGGTPGINKVLTDSDGTGLATWTDISSTAGPWTLSGSNLYPDSTSYNVGIGTTVPSTILQVGDGTPNYATGNDVYIANDLEVDGTIYGGTFSGTFNPGFTTGSVIFQGAAGLAQDNANFFWDDSSKELGIGTAAPGSKLSVAGNLSVGATYATAAAPTNGAIFEGNVGIGTSTPANLLSIYNTVGGNDSSTTSVILDRYNANAANGLGSNITFRSSIQTAPSTMATLSKIHGLYSVGTTHSYGYLNFQTFYDSTTLKSQLLLASGHGYLTTSALSFSYESNNYFDIKTSGNIGIGTTAPGAKLEINGQVKITGGTPGINKVLTDSDGTGLATWTDVSSTAGPWTLSGSNLYPDSTSYNVGIGTTVPGAYKLNVAGTSYFSDDVKIGNGTFDNPSANEDLYVEGNLEVDGSLYATDIICTNCLDFTEFEDTLDLDANLTLNQTTYTWSQNFTGTDTIGLTYNANSLTSGTAIKIATTSTALTTGGLLNVVASGNPGSSWTGALGTFEYITSIDADIDGSALKVGITGTGAGSGTALNITTGQTAANSYALRVNDDATYTDSTPFVIHATGNVGIGTTVPSEKLQIIGGIKYAGEVHDTSLLIHYGFNSISGTTTTYNEEGTGNNGTLVNQASFTTDSVIGNGIALDGDADIVTIPSAIGLSLAGKTAITVSTWFKTTDTNGGLAAMYLNSSRYSYNLSVYNSKLITCFAIDSATCAATTAQITSTADVNDGKWHLATVTWDGSNVNLYLDSVQVGSSYALSGTLQTGDRYHSLGFVGFASTNPQGPGALLGVLDEAKIYNRVLESDEIIREYRYGTSRLGISSFADATIPGNLGIGTTAPSEKLEVNGNIKASGAIIGTLTGMIKGTSGTLGAVTSTSNYVAYWDTNNTISGEQYLATSRGGLGANVTAAGAGELLYSTATTTYGHLAAGTSGMALISGGAGAPSWGTLGLTYGGTNANLSGVDTGGLIYKGASALAGTAALSGIIQGNGASAPTAITGTANYIPKWSASAPYLTATSTIYDNGNVGIGTTVPTGKLEVAGTVYGQSVFSFGDSTPDLNAYNTIGTGDAASGQVTDGNDLFVSSYVEAGGGYCIGASCITDWSTGGLWQDGTYGVYEDDEAVIVGTDVAFTHFTGGVGDLKVASDLEVLGITYLGGASDYLSVSASGDISLYGAADTIDLNGITSKNLAILNGNVGIGTSVPTQKLDVLGNINGTQIGVNGTYLTSGSGNLSTSNWNSVHIKSIRIPSGSSSIDISTIGANPLIYATSTGNVGIGTTAANTTPVLYAKADGNVGIGTTVPAHKLDVNGTGRFAGAVDFDGDIELNSTLTDINGHVGTNGQVLSSTTTGVDWIDMTAGVGGSGTLNYVPKWTPNTTTLGNSIIWDDGNVGIGTTVPGYKLHVNGTGYFASTLTTNVISNTGALTSSGGVVNINASSNYATNINTGTSTGALTLGGGSGTIQVASTSWNISTAGAISGVTTLVGSSTLAFGGISSQAYNAISDSGTATYAASDNDLYVENILEVGNTLYVGGTQIQQYWKKLAGNLSPLTANDTLSATSSAATVATFTQTDATKLALRAGGTSDGTTLNILGNGNVGIGTSVPGAKLDVNGNILVQGGGSLDTRAAGTLTIGGTTQTGLTLGRSGATTTITGSTVNIANLITNGVVYTSGGNGTLNSEQYLNVARGGTGAGTFTKGILVSPGTTTALTTVYGTDNYLLKWSSSYPTTTSSIWDDGNVGIGTTTPSEKLHVAGNITAEVFFDSNNKNYYLDPATDANSLIVNGNVGIGTTAPTAKLYVWQHSDTDGDAFRVDDSGTANDSTPFVIKADGNVGIGTTDPGAYKLNINGTLNTGAITAPTSSNTINSLVINSGALSSITTLSMSNQLTNSYANSAAINLTGNTSGITFGGTGVNQIITAGTNNLALMPGGNLGVGTTTPGVKFDLIDDSQTAGFRVRHSNLSQGISIGYNTITANGSNSDQDINILSKGTGKTYINNALEIQTKLYGNGANPLWVDDGLYVTSRVQVGTGDDYAKYCLWGSADTTFCMGMYNSHTLGFLNGYATTFTMDTTANRGWLWRDSNDSASQGAMSLTNDGRLYVTSTAAFGGNVGIGTTAPASKLHVKGSMILDDTSPTYSWYEDGGPTNQKNWIFQADGGNLKLYTVNDAKNDYAYILFEGIKSGNTLTSVNLVPVGGNVGIGTTAPTSQLSFGASAAVISMDTADTTDNKTLVLAGGGTGGVTRGASMYLYGNEFATTSTAGQLYLYAGRPGSGTGAYGSIILNTNAGDVLTAARDGNVGIGTTAPTEKLHVNGVISTGGSYIMRGYGSSSVPTRSNGGEFGFYEYGSTHRLYFRGTSSNSYINRSGGGDFSEYFLKKDQNEIIKTGQIVKQGNSNVTKMLGNNDIPLGVVSAFGTRNNDDLNDGMRHLNSNYVNVGLIGQIPVLVTSENGPISVGDKINVSSIYNGFGKKMTESSGYFVATAKQNLQTNPNSCPLVTDINTITWPKDIENYNQDNVCYRLPDNTYVGRIMAYVNTNWYDSNVSLASTGHLIIENQNNNYTVRDTETNNLISKTAAFAEIVSAKIKAGITNTKELVVETVATIQGNLSVLGNVNVNGTLTAQAITSPTITNIHTNIQTLTNRVNNLQSNMDQVLTQDVNTGKYFMSVEALSSINLNVRDMANIANIAIEQNTISTTLRELKFSSLEKINFFDGQVIVAKDGSITSQGQIIVKKGIKVVNDLEQTVASIDASGSAYFAEGVTFDKNIASSSAVIAASQTFAEIGENTSSIITNDEASGQAVLPRGETELIIRNGKVKENSLVYISPEGSTSGQVLYLDSKKENEWFKVKLDLPAQNDIKFNWWVL